MSKYFVIFNNENEDKKCFSGYWLSELNKIERNLFEKVNNIETHALI